MYLGFWLNPSADRLLDVLLQRLRGVNRFGSRTGPQPHCYELALLARGGGESNAIGDVDDVDSDFAHRSCDGGDEAAR
jgi:hypothetical protein